MDRKKKFDNEFEQTVGNFTLNIDFLKMQSKKVNELVSKSETIQKHTLEKMKRMNENMEHLNTGIS